MSDQAFDQSTALLIVDMLNDFVKPGAPLRVEGAEALVPAIQRAIAAARQAGSLVLYLCDSHRPDDREFRAWPAHAVRGSEGAQVIEELKPGPDDPVVEKRRFSGFFGTELDMVLRERGIRRLVLTGILTDICVYHTAVDATQLAYDVLVAKNAVAAATKEDHDFALRQMERLLRVKVVEL
jgi:nicotinamidase-related amidase